MLNYAGNAGSYLKAALIVIGALAVIFIVVNGADGRAKASRSYA
jgi:FtsZ-interacting cell division protein ZipA